MTPIEQFSIQAGGSSFIPIHSESTAYVVIKESGTEDEILTISDFSDRWAKIIDEDKFNDVVGAYLWIIEN